MGRDGALVAGCVLDALSPAVVLQRSETLRRLRYVACASCQSMAETDPLAPLHLRCVRGSLPKEETMHLGGLPGASSAVASRRCADRHSDDRICVTRPARRGCYSSRGISASGLHRPPPPPFRRVKCRPLTGNSGHPSPPRVKRSSRLRSRGERWSRAPPCKRTKGRDHPKKSSLIEATRFICTVMTCRRKSRQGGTAKFVFTAIRTRRIRLTSNSLHRNSIRGSAVT
jgi:hypothetical protein